MAIVTDIAELHATLRSKLPPDRSSLIGIDGFSGSGKSSLACTLCREPGFICISTDRFYNEGTLGRSYADGLRLNELKADILTLQNGARSVIVEGICLRETLAALGLEADLTIYVKRLGPTGIWYDDLDLCLSIEGYEHTAGHWIDTWSKQYHHRFRPHEQADIVYEWVDSDL